MSWHVRESIEVIWITVAAVWLVARLRSKPDLRVERSISRVFQLHLLIAAGILLFSFRPHIPRLETRYLPESVAIAVAGVVMTAFGAGFAIMARLHLGRNWSSVAKIKRDHELIRGGPYRVVRHPIYTGLLIATLGTAIASGQLRGLLAVPLVLLGFWLKARSEERLLLSEFGDRYAQYRREVTSAIVPFLL